MMGVLVGGGEFAHPRAATSKRWWRRFVNWLLGR